VRRRVAPLLPANRVRAGRYGIDEETRNFVPIQYFAPYGRHRAAPQLSLALGNPTAYRSSEKDRAVNMVSLFGIRVVPPTIGGDLQ
jgi:hypothetical protein